MTQMTIFIMFLLLTTLLVRRNSSTRKADYIIPDCIDIQVEVSALKYSQLSSASSGEPSSEIRKRVIAARQIQENRYREYPGIHCNAQTTDRLLHHYCVLDEETNNTL